MSEALIFNIIFLLLDKDRQVGNIEQTKEFKELDKQIKDEYINIVQIIEKEQKIS